MPRTKLDPPRNQQIDWTKAAILERKMALGKEWADIADGTDMTGDVLRKMVSKKHTKEWPLYRLQAVCKALGLKYKGYIIADGPEDRSD